MNMQADPLAFLENYKRIKRHRAFSSDPVGRVIYRQPIGPSVPPRLKLAMQRYVSPIGPKPLRHPLDAICYHFPIGPRQPMRWVSRDILHISTPSEEETGLAFTRARIARRIMMEEALRAGVTVVDIKSSRRTAKVVRPRQIAAYRLATETTYSLPHIGRLMGGRDHTTIMHARNKIQKLIDSGELVL